MKLSSINNAQLFTRQELIEIIREHNLPLSNISNRKKEVLAQCVQFHADNAKDNERKAKEKEEVDTQRQIESEFGVELKQGTGKTPVVIARIMNEARKVREKEGRPYRAIIVAPKNVRMNWESEIHKFATEAGKVTVLRGVNALYRMNELLDAMRVDEDDMYTIVICSYEAIKGSWDHGLKLIEWDLAVADEGHYIKTVKAQRTKYAWKLRDRSRQRMLLTGTPITNTPLDLYAQLEFLGKGYSGFTSWSKFKQFYGVYETNESGHRALVALQNMPFMQERLARYSFIACSTLLAIKS